TVVLSLLASLIYDKFTKLDGLGIPADHLIGDDYGRQRKIYEKFCLLTPKITLLYMTPEKVSASQKLNTRFVIDEANCVSQDFPQVPFIALTATVTPCVRTHILHHLKM
ncbi:Bloom syndrome protein -like protein, partial [Caligus rogercresseyi]